MSSPFDYLEWAFIFAKKNLVNTEFMEYIEAGKSKGERFRQKGALEGIQGAIKS